VFGAEDYCSNLYAGCNLQIIFLKLTYCIIQVFQRLQKLDSHQTLPSIISAAGKEFDIKIC